MKCSLEACRRIVGGAAGSTWRPGRCCTTWVSSWLSSHVPERSLGRYWPGAKWMSWPCVNAVAPMRGATSLSVWTRTPEKSAPKAASIDRRTVGPSGSPPPAAWRSWPVRSAPSSPPAAPISAWSWSSWSWPAWRCTHPGPQRWATARRPATARTGGGHALDDGRDAVGDLVGLALVAVAGRPDGQLRLDQPQQGVALGALGAGVAPWCLDGRRGVALYTLVHAGSLPPGWRHSRPAALPEVIAVRRDEVVVAAEVGRSHEAPEARVLPGDRLDDARHRDRRPVAGGRERGPQGGVADGAAGQLEALGEERGVDVAERRRRRQVGLPDRLALGLGGERELDAEVDAAEERVVDVALEVGRQHDQPVVRLQPLQQVRHLDVGVAVVGVLDLGALAEQGVGLVEEEHDVAGAGGVEHLLEVLLGLADVLADHRRQVELEHVEAEVAGDDLGGQRLAGAGGAGEQRHEAPRRRRLEPPVVVHLVGVAVPRRQLAEQGEALGAHDDVVPRAGRADAPGEVLEPAAHQAPHGAVEVAVAAT